MQKIVFHIGDKKTGTTSIQQALLRQACRCETRSLHYAVDAHEPYHHELAHRLYLGDDAAVRRLFRGLAKRITSSPADVVVVSSELFREVPPAALKREIARHLPHHAHLVQVIAYMRPHVQRFLSIYTQVVKLGFFTGEMEAFFENSLQNRSQFTGELFAEWRKVFGAAFVLRPMVREQLAGGDILHDFFHVALDGAAFNLEAMPRINTSPSLPDLVLLRLFQTTMRDCHKARGDEAGLRPARLRVGEHLSDMLCDRPQKGQPRPRLHRALVECIVDAYGEDAAQADREFFDGTPMQDAMRQALAAAPQERQSLLARDHHPAETLRLIRVWAEMTAEMLMHAPDGWNDHFLAILNRYMRGQEGTSADQPAARAAPSAAKRRRTKAQSRQGTDIAGS